MALKSVSNSVDPAALELQVLARWQREQTFEKSLARRSGAPSYVFYDGPPFATGLPHYGHVLTSYMKDVVPRFQTMRGFHVPRRWGWDCHGLPVELEVEKELGLRSATSVDVGAFNEACESLVLRYASEWEVVMARLGRWVDFSGAYRTMDLEYTDAVVGTFAELYRRGLVYEGHKVVPYCTRCQTPLSNFETRLDDAYRQRTDLAVTVRFPVGDRGALLAWTTTPWTLPANAALAVHPSLVYVCLARGDDQVWLADAARERYASQLAGYVERERRFGHELAGWRCAPPFDFFVREVPVLTAEWVSAGDGTGVVHLAPAFGEDDQVTCAAHDVTGANPVRDDGTYDTSVGTLAGLDVHGAAEPVAHMLAAAGLLFARGEVVHDYPHCWRCDRPLVYRAQPSWYVAASRLRERLLACNARVRWVPPELGEKRFADWLASARDWAVSRNRFWGAPVPVWRCRACGDTTVVGSAAELAARSGKAVTDWHRPAVDAHAWTCGCGGDVRRVLDVLDCWFESGAMPFASQASFPGDFVVEYVAQTRGWFYTMLVLATALRDEPPFRTAMCHGVLLGEDGRKMSKRLRNYPDPMELVAQHGSDALRMALLTSGVMAGSDVRFVGASVRDVVRRVHLPLWNALHLFTAYATADGYEPGAFDPGAATALERALVSEAEMLRGAVEAAMADLDVARVYALLEELVTTLSTWYLRLVKSSLWRDGLDHAKRATYDALYTAFVQFARVSAPFMPFLADAVYDVLGFADSVHLADWPAPRDELRDDALVAEMRALREVVRLARFVREQAGVKHRQPLRCARVGGVAQGVLAQHAELLAAELNVKRVEPRAAVDVREPVLDWGRAGKRLRGRVKEVAAALAAGAYTVVDGCVEAAGERLAADEVAWRTRSVEDRGVAARDGFVVELDLAVDVPLAREAAARELSRAVQDLRKRARLRYGERVQLAVVGESAELAAVLAEHESWLREQCGAAVLVRDPLSNARVSASLELAGAEVAVALAWEGPTG
jgi:isoleucyl-tRNA synthetase